MRKLALNKKALTYKIIFFKLQFLEVLKRLKSSLKRTFTKDHKE